jgi:hypothetical protein
MSFYVIIGRIIQKRKILKNNFHTNKTFNELYQEIINRIGFFKKNEYNVVYIWESEWNEIKNKEFNK